MVGRSLTLAVAILSVSCQAQASDMYAKVKENVLAATTISGFALNGVVVPFAQEKLQDVLPDAGIPGLKTRVKDLWLALIASVTTTGWNVAHTGADNVVQKFIQAVYAEFGYVGLQEVAKQLQLASLFSTQTKANYDAFGVGYVKAAVQAVVATLVEATKHSVTGLFANKKGQATHAVAAN